MKKDITFSSHLSKSEDLITSYEATRSGFLEMALEKNKAANPFVEQAKILKAIAQKTKTPNDLLEISEIEKALIAAAGFSDKASKYIRKEDYKSTILEFINKFLVPAGDSYVDELVYRYLLTKGDSIGGSLRNLVGKIGQKKVVTSIISAISLYKLPFYWFDNKSKKWKISEEFSFDDCDKVNGIAWVKNSSNRTILFNQKVPLVGNNIDLLLLSCNFESAKTVISKSPESFIALGELKGGIDPAGADEHWKTARAAFTRIRNSFSKVELYPDVFFIGGAIEKKMSTEIWNLLESNILTNAANLTNSIQLASLTTWLISK